MLISCLILLLSHLWARDDSLLLFVLFIFWPETILSARDENERRSIAIVALC